MRLRVVWVFVVVTLGVGVYLGYVLVTLPALRVRVIDVRIDGIAVTERDVLAAAAIDRSSNLWLLDTRRMAQRIEAIPYVDQAQVRRELPARLTIAVTEREPAACVDSGAQTATIDDRRRILQAGCARTGALHIALPAQRLGRPGVTASAPELVTLLADARALRAAQVNVRTIGVDRFGGLVAVLPNGVRLLFGLDADVAEKAKLVGPVLTAAAAGRPVRAVDLRAPETPTVLFR